MTGYRCADAVEFEAVNEACTDDPSTARRPSTTTSLPEVERVEHGRHFVACAMKGRWRYLALPRKGDLPGIGSRFKPLTTIGATLHEALAVVVLPDRVIDRLRGM